jgi:excisionase family DNA binding protein
MAAVAEARRSTTETEPVMVTVPELAKMLGIARSTAYVLAQSGTIPTWRSPRGRIVRIPRNELLQWIDGNTHRPVAAE